MNKDSAKNIVVIDDCPDIRKLLIDYLSWKGYPVIVFSRATSALDYLWSQQRGSVALVICDVGLPDMSGFDLLKAVKEYQPNLPVILLSAFRRDSTSEEVCSGAFSYLCKTDGLAKIGSSVDRALRENASFDYSASEDKGAV